MEKSLRQIGVLIIVSISFVGYSAHGQRYKLAWSDEFEAKGLPDSTKWAYDVGDGCPLFCGWGSNEQQYYTFNRSKNARVESGYLIIEAHLEKFGDAEYTSARVVTRGNSDWLYGKIEVRARLPEGEGTRPSIWMLPYLEDRPVKLPNDGQIDIMVHNASEVDVIHGMVETGAYNLSLGTERMGHIQLSAVDKRFHTFSIEWTPTKIEWFVDGKKYHKVVDDGTGVEGWPFFNPFYLILNLSVTQTGVQSLANSNWPQRMEVDFVRVYQRKQRRRTLNEEFNDQGF